MCTEPHWTAYLSALLTPTVAVLGSLIAYRQWRLAQNKLKLDLFDRRFSVFEAARSLIASIMTSGKAKDEEVFKFLFATREAKWLLDSSVAEYQWRPTGFTTKSVGWGWWVVGGVSVGAISVSN